MSTLLQDTFVGTNGTDLTAHTMNVGPGWTQTATWTNAILIQTNRARWPTDAGAVTSDCGQSDYVMQVDFISTASNDSQAQFGLFFRYADDSNRWIWFINGSPNGGWTSRIFETVSGSDTTRDTSNPSFNYGNNTLEVTLSGTSVTCKMNGSTVNSYGSMASGLSNTKVGLYTRDQDATGAMNYDDFFVTGGSSASPNRLPLLGVS